MNSTMRVVLGIGVVVVAVVLLVVLKDDGGDRVERARPPPPRRSSRRRGHEPDPDDRRSKNGKPVGGIAEITVNEGEQVRFKVESDVSDEVHLHGYDIMKDVKAGGSVTLRLPGDDRRRSSRPSSRAARNRSSSCGSTREPEPPRPAARPRAGRAAGPADPGLAVRLGGVDRPDRLLLRALGGLARAALRERTLAPARGGALAGPARPAGAGPLRRDRRLPARRLRSTPGCRGTEAPDRNFALTFVFVTCWLGFPVLSVVFGNVFKPFNPWRAIGRAVGGAFEAIAGQRFAHLAYPERLGRWPAAVGLVAFVWLEIVYGVSGGVAVGVSPHAAGVAALVYSAYTLAMMAVFGVEKWCERGEVFSVYFGMFSRLGFLGVSDGRLGVRRPLLGGDAAGRRCRARSAVVIASIGTTSFDGAQEGAFKSAIESTFEWLLDRSRRTDPRAAPHRHALHGARHRRRRPRLPDRRARAWRRVEGAPPLRKLRPRLRPHADPDRLRLPRRPLLQPLRLPGAGAVHLPALRPARHRHDRPLRHRLRAASTSRSSARTRSGTSRSAPSSSAT